MSAFELLSKSMQKKIWDMKWEQLMPIQNHAIPVIIQTNKDVILSASTASGKTEAAFLPIISLIEGNAEKQLKVLYISPLKALINNQFERIEKLCEYSSIPIHKWHGDVSQSQKKKLVKNPSGILQITPESIESLFINRTEHIRNLFKGIEFIVIDEIHSFINSERGVQLRSLLSRIENYTEQRPRIIGLSATIDNFDLVRKWVNYKDTDNVEVIEEKSSEKELQYHLMYFETGEDRKLPVELFEDMREITKDCKAIVFCNSRGQVEETTVFLNRLAGNDHMGETYYAHHSSIDKAEREYVEKTMIESKYPKTVVATSSLELGIDIGDVDIVIQLDSTFTVSSLKQRMGRSGRKKGSDHMLQLYTTNDDSLLQSLAVMELVLDKWIEPATGYLTPYDILFHQLISICQEMNGIKLESLIKKINDNHIFYTMQNDKIEQIIRHMIENDHLEKIRGSNELIVGIEGERILRSKEFYAVFMTSEVFSVLEGVKKIGTIDKSALLNEGDLFILAGKLWCIHSIDFKKNKIYVKKAVNGKPPRFGNGGMDIHNRIGEKMFEILISTKQFTYYNDLANDTLQDMRKPYFDYRVNPGERVIWKTNDEFIFETFTGSKNVQNIVWALRFFGLNCSTNSLGRIKINNFKGDLVDILREVNERVWKNEDLLSVTLEHEIFVSKYSTYLPFDLQTELQIMNNIDLKGMANYFASYSFRVIDLE